MVKITKRIVETPEAREKDYVIWDDELSGFGLRVFSSGKRSYVVQYRIGGRSRRYRRQAVKDRKVCRQEVALWRKVLLPEPVEPGKALGIQLRRQDVSRFHEDALDQVELRLIPVELQQ
jgi:hypothetical protein